MKQRCWQVTRQLSDAIDAAHHWDQVYRTILFWTVTPFDGPPDCPGVDRDAQELNDAGCSVCPSLDLAPSPESGA